MSAGGPAAAQAFPGATGVTLLDVYDWTAPDGLRGGSAHIHLASTEGYLVLRGAGRLRRWGHRASRRRRCARVTACGSPPAPCTAWSTTTGSCRS